MARWTRKRGSVLWVAILMVMIDAIRRFFGEFRPTDVVSDGLELAFIMVVVWLELPDLLHKRRLRKRLKMIHGTIFAAQRLEGDAPKSGSTDEDAALAWVNSVQVWVSHTEGELSKHSVSAEISFKTHRYLTAGVVFGGISRLANAQDWFRELRARMLALQDIMEKADVYFE